MLFRICVRNDVKYNSYSRLTGSVIDEVKIMNNDKDIGKSAEDYLESMIILKERNGYVRSVDIAGFLGVTKPSVSNAMKRLREEGYIEMANSGYISVTEKGMAIADKIYTRHKKLTGFFVALGVDTEIAEEDACKIEHDLSDETFDAICAHFENLGRPDKSKKK